VEKYLLDNIALALDAASENLQNVFLSTRHLCASGVFAKDSNNSKKIIRKIPMTKRVSLIIFPNSGPGIF
jgi:hypothetical protein